VENGGETILEKRESIFGGGPKESEKVGAGEGGEKAGEGEATK
jgi:hypothetical protein